MILKVEIMTYLIIWTLYHNYDFEVKNDDFVCLNYDMPCLILFIYCTFKSQKWASIPNHNMLFSDAEKPLICKTKIIFQD